MSTHPSPPGSCRLLASYVTQPLHSAGLHILFAPKRRMLPLKQGSLTCACTSSPHAATALILAGCATQPRLAEVETPGMVNPEAALQRSVARVAAAMAQLGRMGTATRPYAGGAVVPPELQRQVSLTWSGSIDQAAKAPADQVGYRFVSTGPTSPPVAVAIDGKNSTILVDRAPEVMKRAVDADEDLIQMPDVARLRPTSAEPLGELRAELSAPAADALVRHRYAPLRKDELDLAQAQAEHVVQPDGVADDRESG